MSWSCYWWSVGNWILQALKECDWLFLFDCYELLQYRTNHPCEFFICTVSTYMWWVYLKFRTLSDIPVGLLSRFHNSLEASQESTVLIAYQRDMADLLFKTLGSSADPGHLKTPHRRPLSEIIKEDANKLVPLDFSRKPRIVSGTFEEESIYFVMLFQSHIWSPPRISQKIDWLRCHKKRVRIGGFTLNGIQKNSKFCRKLFVDQVSTIYDGPTAMKFGCDIMYLSVDHRQSKFEANWEWA